MTKLDIPFYKPGTDITGSDTKDSSELLIEFIFFPKANGFLFMDSDIKIDNILGQMDTTLYFNNSEFGKKFREKILKELVDKNKLDPSSIKSIYELTSMFDIMQCIDDKNKACAFYEVILPKYYPYIEKSIENFIKKTTLYCKQKKSNNNLAKEEIELIDRYESYIHDIFSAIINEHITKIINLISRPNCNKVQDKVNIVLASK